MRVKEKTRDIVIGEQSAREVRRYNIANEVRGHLETIRMKYLPSWMWQWLVRQHTMLVDIILPAFTYR